MWLGNRITSLFMRPLSRPATIIVTLLRRIIRDDGN